MQYLSPCLLTSLGADLPYLETAAARGALIMHMDFRQRIPMASGAVDMVHCSWLFNVLESHEEMERVLMEWDRLVRPGGLIVQHGFRSKSEQVFSDASAHIRRVATFLQWDIVSWSTKNKVLHVTLARGTTALLPQ